MNVLNVICVMNLIKVFSCTIKLYDSNLAQNHLLVGCLYHTKFK